MIAGQLLISQADYVCHLCRGSIPSDTCLSGTGVVSQSTTSQSLIGQNMVAGKLLISWAD